MGAVVVGAACAQVWAGEAHVAQPRPVGAAADRDGNGRKAGFADGANEDLSSPLVLRLSNVEKDIGGCVEITISGGFQGISNVEEIKACGSRVYKIDDNLDGYNAPQIDPQFDDSEPNTEEDVSPVRKG